MGLSFRYGIFIATQKVLTSLVMMCVVKERLKMVLIGLLFTVVGMIVLVGDFFFGWMVFGKYTTILGALITGIGYAIATDKDND